ncbi:MAG: chorismate synthase [Oscillospiraceae bacterium]|nr:chorismate synthase [Oscillospiraceae bacterium]MDD4413112.1 chorismate synthase [Oscillospiraceae bacterium]
MSSGIGNRMRCTIFGESHGKAIGCVVEGLPAGEKIDMDEVLIQLARRAPGRDKIATPRSEEDLPEILSGMLDGRTTGAPLAIMIVNHNTRSGDYDDIARMPRPGHADYTGHVRYDGFNDIRGGGHFSGRLTAPLVFAGAVCRQILRRRGVHIGGHILEIHGVRDKEFDPVNVNGQLLEQLAARSFSLIDKAAEDLMREQIKAAQADKDSVGGIVEAAAVGLPAGLGSPMFDGVENRLAALLFGIPAVKGVEFGAGFGFASMTGSTANDPYDYDKDGNVITLSNNNGGILGGITSGMPLIVRVAIKPTPSIPRPQKTIDLIEGKPAEISIGGRHDPCIVPRALPVVEAALALGLLDLAETENKGG